METSTPAPPGSVPAPRGSVAAETRALWTDTSEEDDEQEELVTAKHGQLPVLGLIWF